MRTFFQTRPSHVPVVPRPGLQPGATAVRRAGFSLMEMLVVIVIIGVLIGMLGASYISARNHARRGRAETQLRELVKAWDEYFLMYGSFPNSGDTIMSYHTTLQPLLSTDSTGHNTKQIPFLSIKMGTGDYCDPWGNPYHINFSQPTVPQEVALRIAVSFPNRDRYR